MNEKTIDHTFTLASYDRETWCDLLPSFGCGIPHSQQLLSLTATFPPFSFYSRKLLELPFVTSPLHPLQTSTTTHRLSNPTFSILQTEKPNRLSQSPIPPIPPDSYSYSQPLQTSHHDDTLQTKKPHHHNISKPAAHYADLLCTYIHTHRRCNGLAASSAHDCLSGTFVRSRSFSKARKPTFLLSFFPTIYLSVYLSSSRRLRNE